MHVPHPSAAWRVPKRLWKGLAFSKYVQVCVLQSYIYHQEQNYINYPDSKVHGANMGPIWGREDPGGPHVGPMDFAIWVSSFYPLIDFNTRCIMVCDRLYDVIWPKQLLKSSVARESLKIHV